jgi:hypothetical protein
MALNYGEPSMGAKHYREQANQMRDLAIQISFAEGRQQLLQMAEEFDRLADRADEQAHTAESFQFRIDLWDMRGAHMIEHVAKIENLEGAEALYKAAVERWPNCRVILRQRETIIRDSG